MSAAQLLLATWLFTAVTLGTLTACSGRVALSDARQAPSERVLAFQTASPENGTLVVIRDGGPVGSGCYFAFYINRTLATRLDVGERARFFVEPGGVLL